MARIEHQYAQKQTKDMNWSTRKRSRESCTEHGWDPGQQHIEDRHPRLWPEEKCKEASTTYTILHLALLLTAASDSVEPQGFYPATSEKELDVLCRITAVLRHSILDDLLHFAQFQLRFGEAWFQCLCKLNVVTPLLPREAWEQIHVVCLQRLGIPIRFR